MEPASVTMPVTYARWPVSRFSSARKSLGPAVVMYRRLPAYISETSTAPSSSTIRSYLGSPAANSTWPTVVGSTVPYCRKVASWSSLSLARTSRVSSASGGLCVAVMVPLLDTCRNDRPVSRPISQGALCGSARHRPGVAAVPYWARRAGSWAREQAAGGRGSVDCGTVEYPDRCGGDEDCPHGQ